MPTQFSVPKQIITAGTAPAPSRRPSMAHKQKIDVSVFHNAPPLGYSASRGGWSSQGGYNGIKYRVPDLPPQLYESPLKGTGEPTLIPSGSLRDTKRNHIVLPNDEYEKIKMTPPTQHPIYEVPHIDALKLYQ